METALGSADWPLGNFITLMFSNPMTDGSCQLFAPGPTGTIVSGAILFGTKLARNPTRLLLITRSLDSHQINSLAIRSAASRLDSLAFPLHAISIAVP